MNPPQPTAKMSDTNVNLADIYRQVDQSSPLAILGLKPGASIPDVRAAYRFLALILHPDKCDWDLRDKHSELFQKVQEAFETLQANPPDPSDTDLTDVYRQVEQSDCPFAILGLEPGASRLEIKLAYRSLARILHPDKCDWDRVDKHTELFQKVQKAFEHLTANSSDPPPEVPATM